MANYNDKKDKSEYIINEDIRAKEVRITGDDIESQVCSLREAIEIAEDMELDVILISPNANPPVVKIANYSKFLYQQKKKKKEQENNSAKTEVKEVRYTPNTGEHDYAFKLNHIKSFLEEGNKVKISIFFKGRTIQYKAQGEELLDRIKEDIKDIGIAEGTSIMEGKKMLMTIRPKK